MRILSLQGRLLACLLIVTLSLSSLFAQEKGVHLKTFLDLATEEIPVQTMPQSVYQDKSSSNEFRSALQKITEEIPVQTMPQSVYQDKSSNNEFRFTLQKITEEIPDKAKPRFVSTKQYAKDNLKIQLGYFKEKRNVNKMINKIKSKYEWSLYVKTEKSNGTDYYRVMIVDISNRRAANVIMGQLKHEGLKAIIK